MRKTGVEVRASLVERPQRLTKGGGLIMSLSAYADSCPCIRRPATSIKSHPSRSKMLHTSDSSCSTTLALGDLSNGV